MVACLMDLESLDVNAKSQLACSMAALLLHDEKSDVTAEKIAQVVQVAGVSLAAYWPMLMAKNLEGGALAGFLNVGAPAASAPAAAPKTEKVEVKKEAKKEEKKEEPEEELDMDMGGLFD